MVLIATPQSRPDGLPFVSWNAIATTLQLSVNDKKKSRNQEAAAPTRKQESVNGFTG